MTKTTPADSSPEVVFVGWLAHQRRDQRHRCVLMRWRGNKRLAVCARCLGLYPALLAVLGLQLLLGRPGPAGTLDWWLVLGASAPAMVDWGLSRLGARGSNLVRIITGTLLGAALGRSLLLHFQDPLCEVLWVQLLLLLFGALGFEVARLSSWRKA